MGKVLITSDYVTSIADALRNKLGTANKFTLAEIADCILSSSDELSLDIIANGYSSAETYTVGDFVTYNGKLYACTSEILSSEDFDASHWHETSIGEELSSIFKAGDADETYY